MGHLFGLLAIVPVTMLLTVSFFVLFTRQKTEDAGLKTFALVIAVCLWVAAALVLGGGIFTLSCGGHACCGKTAMGKMFMHPSGWEKPCLGAPGQNMMPGGGPQPGQPGPASNQNEPKHPEKKK